MPLADRPWAAATALLYLAVVAGIGWWSRSRTRTTDDFYLAGRRPGLWMTALATMATAFSGFLFLGGPGLAYRLGFGAFFIFLPLGLTPALLVAGLGRRLRRLAAEGEVYTVSDLLLRRYGSRGVGGAAAVAVLLGSVGYLGTQIQALGILLASVFGWQASLGGWAVPAASALGLAVVLLYSVGGGMLGGVVADCFQGALMLVAAVAVFAHALAVAGGPAAIATALAADPAFGPGFLEPLGRIPAWTAFGWFLVFGVGVAGQPQMLHKFFMLRDEKPLRLLPFVLGGAQSICLLVPLGLGLAVPALVAQGRLAAPAGADEAAPAFLLAFAPGPLTGLVLAGAIAAIMSTANSFLVLAGAALVRDLPRALGRKRAATLAAGRWSTLLVALAAAGFAFLYDDLVALLGSFSFGLLAAALAPTVGLGLAWKRAGALAALGSIWTGLSVHLLLELGGKWVGAERFGAGLLPEGLPPAAAALLASTAVLLLLGWLRPAPGGEQPGSGRRAVGRPDPVE
jgi:Na+/proline symporter